LVRLAEDFSGYARNFSIGSGRKGIAAGGVSWMYVREAVRDENPDCRLLKISTYPLPEKLCLDFLREVDEVLVVEELDPFIERELISICGANGLRVKIRGKTTGDMPAAGENSPESAAEAIAKFLGAKETAAASPPTPPSLPVRPPVLCAGCPHRASFFAVKEAAKGHKAVFSGDIGCYTLGNAAPLDMVDTCLCMGAGITMAQGINRVEPDTANFAFIGDSTFFHTGVPGIVNAVYNGANIIVAILDNGTTAMTGGQPHPGTGKTIGGEPAEKIDIARLLGAIGVKNVTRVNAFDFKSAKAAVKTSLGERGVRAIIFEGECVINGAAKGKKPSLVDETKCAGCGVCFKKLGCPALSVENKKTRIGETCTGCGLCAEICPAKAIGGGTDV
jgi:indolepyruvate ferredoxin oxidoreductase alpha subunit